MTSAEAPRFDRDTLEFGRAIGFFDATFAIAATLLVTTLESVQSGWTSWSAFWSTFDGPLLAFAISFWVVVTFWWANHKFVRSLRRLSPSLIGMNLVFLGFVVLLPFTTDGLGQSDVSAEVTTVVYAVNVAVVSLLAFVLHLVARHDDLYRPEVARSVARADLVARLGPAVVFLASVPIALLGAPIAARYVWLALIPVGRYTGVWAEQRQAPGA
jgi:uncharacterized membrane protein